MNFKGKSVIVTGSTGGLGRGIAILLAERGASVVVSGRNEEEGAKTVQRIKESGPGRALFVKCDISIPEEVDHLVEKALKEFGKLDCAVNNAGISGDLGPIGETSLDVWNQVVGVNLTGTFLCLKREIQAMVKTGGGSIVNVSSALGLRGKENLAPYVATKHGIVRLTKTAAFEYGKQGIRVNALCPGGIYTEMDDLLYANSPDPDKLRSERMKSYALGRMAHVEEVARAAVWLCSDEASFVTGAVLPVDGGKTAK